MSEILEIQHDMSMKWKLFFGAKEDKKKTTEL